MRSSALTAPRRGYVGFSLAKFNEGVIPILLVGVITGMMLFLFNETSDRITRLEDRITRLEENIDARFTKLEDGIDARFTAVDARRSSLNQASLAVVRPRHLAAAIHPSMSSRWKYLAQNGDAQSKIVIGSLL